MDNINDQVNDLIAGFLTGEISAEDLTHLQKWVESSDKHRRYFEEMKVTWQAAGSVDSSTVFNSEKAWQKVSGKPAIKTYSNRRKVSMNLMPPATKRIIRRTLQTAGAVMAIFLGGALTAYYMLKPKIDHAEAIAVLTGSEYKIVVPRGAKSTIVLPDGTKVVVNAASKLTYATSYGFTSREVSLEGEAYFDVRTNPEKPFTIHTSDLDIKAFGTAFNVKAYPEDPTIVATLEHGELKLQSRNNNAFDMVLQPKQNVVYYKTCTAAVEQKENAVNQTTTPPPVEMKKIPPAAVTNNVNTYLYTSWKDPEWMIESQTFGELAISLERRYNVRVVFGSNDLRNYRFSGTIRNETIEQILNALTITAPMKYYIDQGVVQLQIDKKRKQNYDALSK